MRSEEISHCSLLAPHLSSLWKRWSRALGEPTPRCLQGSVANLGTFTPFSVAVAVGSGSIDFFDCKLLLPLPTATELVSAAGIEPAQPGLKARYSAELSYTPQKAEKMNQGQEKILSYVALYRFFREATAGLEPATFPICGRNALTEVSLFLTAACLSAFRRGGDGGNRTRDLRTDNPLFRR